MLHSVVSAGLQFLLEMNLHLTIRGELEESNNQLSAETKLRVPTLTILHTPC